MESYEFLEGRILPSLVRFSIPLMLSLLLQALYGGVDLMVVGNFGSTASVSAVATGSQVMQTVTGIVAGLATGVTVLIGNSIGSGDKEKAGRTAGGMIFLFSLISVVITAVMFLFTESVANFMHVPPEAMAGTLTYIRICSVGIAFIAAYNGISGIFRGLGNSKSPLLFILIAAITNIVGDLLFVGVFKMDVAGAALATVFSQGVSVAFSLWYVGKNGLPFKINKTCFHGRESVLSILKIGTPIALQDFLTSVSFLIITAIVNSLGVIASASMGIAEKLFVFLAIVPMSFMSALSAFVAQNIGAGEFKRAKKSLFIAMGISFCFGFAMFLLTFLGGDILAGIFESNQLVIASTRDYLRSCSFEHLLIPFTFCFLGYFNGMGKTNFVMFQGFIAAFLVRIPVSYFLSRIPNTNMFYIGLAVPVSAGAALLMCLIYYALRQRNLAAVRH